MKSASNSFTPKRTFVFLLVLSGFVVVSKYFNLKSGTAVTDPGIFISKSTTSIRTSATAITTTETSIPKSGTVISKAETSISGPGTLFPKPQTQFFRPERPIPLDTKTHLVRNLSSVHKYTTSDILRYENNYGPMDDPGLIGFIQQRYLMYPSEKPSIMGGPEVHVSQEGQSEFVDKILNRKNNGFFVEAGASDGLHYSNSFFFEKYRAWTGLLVEPNTKPFQQLLKNRPASYAFNGCLGIANKTGKVEFLRPIHEELAGIFQGQNSANTLVNIIQSLPLYSLVKAIGVDTIDYFSLDVEGPELAVLKTIPWDKLKINVITLEFRAAPDTKNEADVSKQRFIGFMNYFKSLGIYNYVKTISGLDLVFARKDLEIKADT